MITSAKYVNYIVETVNVLRQEIISRDKLGLYDENKVAENFVCKLLNMCYGYNLVNLNEKKANFPGIDLGDEKLGIGFQVTSTKTSAKVNETLKKCCENNCYDVFPNIKFFIITEKQSSYSVTYEFGKNINFDWKDNILDFDSLYIKIMYLDVSKQREICEYVHEQIPYVSASLGIDFYSPNLYKRIEKEFKLEDWKSLESGSYELCFEHNFGYIPHVSVLENGTEVMCDTRVNEKTVIIVANCKFNGKVILS